MVLDRREFIGSLLAGMLVPNSGTVLTGDVRGGDPSYVVCTIKGTSCGSASKVLSLTHDEVSTFMNSYERSQNLKTTEDVCTNKDCQKRKLSFDLGQLQTFNEPSLPAVLYCELCGSEYEIDWERMSLEEIYNE